MNTKPRFLLSLVTFGLLIIASVPLLGAEGPYHFLKEIPVGGLGGWDCLFVDSPAQRLYVSHATRLAVIDLSRDEQAGEIADPIGSGVDANCFDPATQLAFSSNGEGNVTIAREDSPDRLTVVQTLQTEKGAKTMILDPATHKIYLGSAKFEPAQSGKRPAPIPGSFRMLVYGMDKAPAR
jgi:hypothetical protein